MSYTPHIICLFLHIHAKKAEMQKRGRKAKKAEMQKKTEVQKKSRCKKGRKTLFWNLVAFPVSSFAKIQHFFKI